MQVLVSRDHDGFCTRGFISRFHTGEVIQSAQAAELVRKLRAGGATSIRFAEDDGDWTLSMAARQEVTSAWVASQTGLQT